MSQPPERIDPIELGRRLQTIRKLSGRTQSDVAVALGVSVALLWLGDLVFRRYDGRFAQEL